MYVLCYPCRKTAKAKWGVSPLFFIVRMKSGDSKEIFWKSRLSLAPPKAIPPQPNRSPWNRKRRRRNCAEKQRPLLWTGRTAFEGEERCRTGGGVRPRGGTGRPVGRSISRAENVEKEVIVNFFFNPRHKNCHTPAKIHIPHRNWDKNRLTHFCSEAQLLKLFEIIFKNHKIKLKIMKEKGREGHAALSTNHNWFLLHACSRKFPRLTNK